LRRKFIKALIFFSLFVSGVAGVPMFPVQKALAVPIKGSQFLISAHCPYATAAAVKIGDAGGSVTDMAVTALIVMSVTNPSFASLGGGGFAVVKDASAKDASAKDRSTPASANGASETSTTETSAVETLDFRETAPQSTNPDFFKSRGPKASTIGGAAVAVPGIVAGIEALHKRYGKIHWSRLFDDAIQLAEKGYRVTGEWADRTNQAHANFNAAGKKYFSSNNGTPLKSGNTLKPGGTLQPGDTLKQPQLAKLLRELRNRRGQAFYTGEAARDIVRSVTAEGGVLTLKDLKDYTPKWREPVVDEFRGLKVYSMPLPSSGGLILRNALRLTTPFGVEAAAARSADEYHRLIEVIKTAFSVRHLLGDPDFSDVPLSKFLSRDWIEKALARFDAKKATQPESPETSHISVMNSDGDAIALTMTLNGSYGSGIATEKFGIFMNNEMDDFTTIDQQQNAFGLIQGRANNVQGGKRPLSSMTPTLVEDPKKGVILALGAPGGPRIISSVYQALFRVLVREDSIDQAIQTARVHHQFQPDKVYADLDRLSPEVIANLKDRGHNLEQGWQGRVFAVQRKGDVLEGAFDSRGEGSVAGH
jgi:gamma-glutamyltranspeptidase / glutathione hydrolase